MKIACIATNRLIPQSGHEPYNAMISAMKKDGHEVIYSDRPVPADVCLLWNVQFRNPLRKEIYNWYRSQGIPVLIMEVGALNRNVLWRVGLNNIDNTAEFGLEQGIDPDRSPKLNLTLTPWRKIRGDDILIALQNDKCANWPYEYSISEWLIDTIKEIRKHSNRRIIIRPHPRKRDSLSSKIHKYNNIKVVEPKTVPRNIDQSDFQQTLDNIWSVINVSSNPAIESVMSGVPAFVALNNLAAPVCYTDLSKIEKPLLTDRFKWLNRLAHTEWSVEEIKNGKPWQRIKPYI